MLNRHLLLAVLPSALVSAAVSLAMMAMFESPATGLAAIATPEAASQRSPAGFADKASFAAAKAGAAKPSPAIDAAAVAASEDGALKTRMVEMSEDLALLRVELQRQMTLVESLLEQREQQKMFETGYEPDEADLVELQELDKRNGERAREQLAQHHADTADAFSVEDDDATWTAKLEQRLETADGDGVFLESSECRQSLCRLVVEYEDALARLEFESRLPQLVRGIAGGMTAAGEIDDQAGGAMRGVFYLERPR